jgi:uncharacterized protein (TIGR00369 family)
MPAISETAMPSSPNDTPSPDLLGAWQAEEARVRARLMPTGLARPDQVAGKTGMQVFEGMLGGQLPPPPIAETLDFALISAAYGEAVFQGRPLLRHYNPLGSVHGGWFATLLDSAVGCAVHTTLPAGKSYTTAELKINIVRPLTTRVPLVRAVGRIVHLGTRMATAEGRLTGPDGKLYAHASTTCFIFDTP